MGYFFVQCLWVLLASLALPATASPHLDYEAGIGGEQTAQTSKPSYRSKELKDEVEEPKDETILTEIENKIEGILNTIRGLKLRLKSRDTSKVQQSCFDFATLIIDRITALTTHYHYRLFMQTTEIRESLVTLVAAEISCSKEDVSTLETAKTVAGDAILLMVQVIAEEKRTIENEKSIEDNNIDAIQLAAHESKLILNEIENKIEGLIIQP